MGTINDALQGTYGTPSDTNRYVTDDDPRLSGDVIAPAMSAFFFGSGFDGALTVSAGTTTLARPMAYASVTGSGTAAINTAGFPVQVSGILNITASPAGLFSVVGGNGLNATTTGGASGGTVGGGASFACQGVAGANGAAGGTAAGNVAAAASAAANQQCGGGSGAGGKGGNAGANNGGASRAGVNAPALANAYTPVTPLEPHHVWLRSSGGSISMLLCGLAAPGGSGGAGDGTAGGGGGGGGAGGGSLALYARYIERGASTTAGTFRAVGGNGGNGGVPAAGNRGGGGAGGGGGGGIVLLVYGELIGSPATDVIDCSGGTGGNGGNPTGTGLAGDGGTGGAGGCIHVCDLATNTITLTNGRTTAGTAHAGQTGGAGTATVATL